MNIELKIARVKAGLTQEALAKALGITREHYANIETGNAQGSLNLFKRLQVICDLSDETTWKIAKGGV